MHFSITLFSLIFIMIFTSCSNPHNNVELAEKEVGSNTVLSEEDKQNIKDLLETINKTELDWKIELLDANKISDRLYFAGSKDIVRIVNSRGFSNSESRSQGYSKSVSVENQTEKPIGKIGFRFFHYDEYGDIMSSGKFELLESSKTNDLTIELNKPLLISYEIGELNLARVSSFPRVEKGETLVLLVDSVFFHESKELKFNNFQWPTLDEAIEKRK